jgi:hypothetical protein
MTAEMGIGDFGPPLHVASLMGKIDIIPLLLGHGAKSSECELEGISWNGMHLYYD